MAADAKQQVKTEISRTFNMFNAIVIIAIIVSLLGVINTLAMSVIERTREIGVLRALGSSRWQVRSTMLDESLMITLTGALVGVGAGALIGFMWLRGVDEVMPGMSFHFPTGTVVDVAVAAVLLGVLAAVLWSGGISFAGVIAFIFADLIVLPILAIYRKYYGLSFALRITALMFVTIAISALVVDGLFGLAGLIPSERPSQSDVFGSVELDYKAALNAIALAVFAALLWLTVRRGATDPVCGMKVDRAKAKTLVDDGRTIYFCSDDCLHEYQRRTTNV